MKKKDLERHFEDYVINNKEPIYRLAYRYVRNVEDALDIVQESIYKGISSLESLKDINVIKTWFYRIVVNTSLDFIRKRNRETVIDGEYLFENELIDTDNYANIDLERALEKLPYSYRTIIILRYFEDLKINEIAEVLDINISTIKTRLYKGLELLKVEMNTEDRRLGNGI
ncbi:MAG: polymerase, sigma-24 subunit, subfamily [Sedimentibacter sp.]|nr:polymerase, sigma-24 subunit, subfamily [Sedimentibacter sp.]